MPGNSPMEILRKASRRSRTASRMSPRPCRPWRTTMTSVPPPCPPEDSHERPFRRGPAATRELRLPTMRTLWRSFTERADREGWPAARLLWPARRSTASGGASSRAEAKPGARPRQLRLHPRARGGARGSRRAATPGSMRAQTCSWARTGPLGRRSRVLVRVPGALPGGEPGPEAPGGTPGPRPRPSASSTSRSSSGDLGA